MKQKWKSMQFVEISMHEIFAFQDRIDEAKGDADKLFEIFDDFLDECESQLELAPDFLKELHEIDLEKDFVPLTIKEIDELFEDDDGENCCNVAEDYVNYVLYHKGKVHGYTDRIKSEYDIPFRPRLNF